MRDRYPEIEPFDHGMLDVGDGQLVYWEACGSPGGKPAVVLHGGPGSGCTPGFRRYFDPDAFRIVLFDQRGCGRSLPSAGEPTTDLSVNTTRHLIDDIERLRMHLEIERWLVFGGSWGATLALGYAERHPERVTEIVLPAVTMSRSSEIHWLTHGVGRFLPQQWERFRDGVPVAERDGDLIEAYARLLAAPDDAVRQRAARAWCEWEDAVVSLEPEYEPNPRYDDPTFRMIFARLVTHYFRHQAWLEEGVLLREAHRLHGIPGALIHGRLDLGSPALTAWELARAWPDARLELVDTGHTGGSAMTDRIVAATDRFREP